MKEDILPKKHRSEEEWREIYEDHKSLGISMTGFCKSKGIALSSYTKWYRRFSGNEEKTSKFKELLKEIVTRVSNNKTEMELVLGEGISLRIVR